MTLRERFSKQFWNHENPNNEENISFAKKYFNDLDWVSRNQEWRIGRPLESGRLFAKDDKILFGFLPTSPGSLKLIDLIEEEIDSVYELAEEDKKYLYCSIPIIKFKKQNE